MRAEFPSWLINSLLKWMLNRRPFSFACVDQTLRIRLAGPGLEKFLEIPIDNLVGAYLPDVFIEFAGLEEDLLAIMDGRTAHFHLSPIEREEEGTRRYLSLEFWHLEDGEWPGLLVVEDVTSEAEQEQRMLQERNELRLLRAKLSQANTELQRLVRFKSFILSMAAHDLKSPLSVIRSSIQLVLDNPQAAASLELLEFALSSANRLSNLISGLLAQDQAEQGKLVLYRQTCDLNALIQRVIRMMHPAAASRIQIEASSKKIELEADPEKLQQVFYNLIDNALKYAPANQPVTVSIGLRRGSVVVQVSDKGGGIPPERVAQLFQPYYRTEEARQSSLPGTGLGLFIVKTLVEAHGGRVEVQSQMGEGTTFSVYLPVGKK